MFYFLMKKVVDNSMLKEITGFLSVSDFSKLVRNFIQYFFDPSDLENETDFQKLDKATFGDTLFGWVKSSKSIELKKDSTTKISFLENKVLDVSTMKLSSYEKENYIFRSINVKYQPASPTPETMDLLLELCCGDRYVLLLFRTLLRLVLLDDNKYQIAFCLFGEKGNQKSLLVELIEMLIGGDTIRISLNKWIKDVDRITRHRPSVMIFNDIDYKQLSPPIQTDLKRCVNGEPLETKISSTGTLSLPSCGIIIFTADARPPAKFSENLFCGDQMAYIAVSNLEKFQKRNVKVKVKEQFRRELGLIANWSLAMSEDDVSFITATNSLKILNSYTEGPETLFSNVFVTDTSFHVKNWMYENLVYLKGALLLTGFDESPKRLTLYDYYKTDTEKINRNPMQVSDFIKVVKNEFRRETFTKKGLRQKKIQQGACFENIALSRNIPLNESEAYDFFLTPRPQFLTI